MKKLQDIKLRHNDFRTFALEILGYSEEEKAEFDFPVENDKFAPCTAMQFSDIEWEHVTLNTCRYNRCPTYEEMVHLKEKFWTEEEVALQIHPPKSEYINKCEYTLHLWRNRNVSKQSEMLIRRKIEKVLKTGQHFYEKGKRKEILLEEDTKVVLIFCGKKWLTWEEICQIKQKYFDEEEAAVQFNISQAFDLNEEHIIVLWDATDFDLPPKELV